jgi:hypothetical protein
LTSGFVHWCPSVGDGTVAGTAVKARKEFVAVSYFAA